MIGIGAPKPPKNMQGAPKFPGADADSGADQGKDDSSPEEMFHCPACGSKICVSVAPDDGDGDEMAPPDQSADQSADQGDQGY